MDTTITTDEWVAELAKVCAETKSQGDNGFTAQELCDHLGFGRAKVLRMLHVAIAGGHIKVGRALRTYIDGVQHPIVVYCPIVKPKAKVKKK